MYKRQAVNSEGKTNEATKNLKEPLQKGQTAPKDNKQQQLQELSLIHILRETGNLGRVVDIVDRETGEIIPSFISIDRKTNEITDIPANKVRIPCLLYTSHSVLQIVLFEFD